VVGNATEIKPPVDALGMGAPKVVDITIPGAPGPHGPPGADQ
jgi:hypothetical protein